MNRVWRLASAAMRLDVAVLLGFAAIDALGNLLPARLPLGSWPREFAFSLLEFGPALILVRVWQWRMEVGRPLPLSLLVLGTAAVITSAAVIAAGRMSQDWRGVASAWLGSSLPCALVVGSVQIPRPRRPRAGARTRGAAGHRPARGGAAGGPCASARGPDRAPLPLQHAGQRPSAGTHRSECRDRDADRPDRVPRDVAPQPSVAEHHAGTGARAPGRLPPAASATVRKATALRHLVPGAAPPLRAPFHDAPHPGRELDPARARALPRGWDHPALGRGVGTRAPGTRSPIQGPGMGAGSGGGTGLSNVRSRLALRYGDAARLTLSLNAPRGVRASLRLPLTPGSRHDGRRTDGFSPQAFACS